MGVVRERGGYYWGALTGKADAARASQEKKGCLFTAMPQVACAGQRRTQRGVSMLIGGLGKQRPGLWAASCCFLEHHHLGGEGRRKRRKGGAGAVLRESVDVLATETPLPVVLVVVVCILLDSPVDENSLPFIWLRLPHIRDHDEVVTTNGFAIVTCLWEAILLLTRIIFATTPTNFPVHTSTYTASYESPVPHSAGQRPPPRRYPHGT